MFCKHCGQQTAGDAEICESCLQSQREAESACVTASQPDDDAPASSNPDVPQPSFEVLGMPIKPWHIAVFAVFVIVIIGFAVFFGTRCGASGCYEAATCGKYCERHVCTLYPSCENEKAYDSDYCYYHQSLLEDLTSKSKNISISGVYLDRSYSKYYTKASGKVTNNGTITLDFVKVRGAFKDSKGNVVETDWTYAVGSEGLAPGESKSFELTVASDSSIASVDVTVMDD